MSGVTWRWFVVLTLGVGLCGCSSDDDEGDNSTVDAGVPSLDPASLPKYAQPLVVPPVMPPTGENGGVTEYRIAVRQFQQQMLPPPLPMTTVWGYGRDGDPLPGEGAATTFSSPGHTIETRSNTPVRVTWINGLVDADGGYLPHLLPVDATIHWADPGGTSVGHEHDGDPRYTGPVPITTHVHGAHAFDHSDGHPESWFLPDANDIPSGFATTGAFYHSQAEAGAGAAVFDYPQDEGAATLWYHDHSLGITRLNIYAGLAGFWIIRDDVEDGLGLPGPAPRAGDPEGTRYYEIPLVIQDRTFAPDGSLSFPSSRTMYDGYTGPFIPDSEVPPIWGPEFIGNVMVVNGRVWPYLEVEPRIYRFRILNASDARTLKLGFDREGMLFTQIGTDGGMLPDAPLDRTELLIGAAERYDVLIDFSSLLEGDRVILTNTGPDEPWGGPDADPPQDPADPNTTGQVMEFRVIAAPSATLSTGTRPASLPPITVPTTELAPRDLVLVELAKGDFPYHVRLGTVALGPLPWEAPVSEVIELDATEIWRVANTTGDAHPIHIHLIDFLVLDRTPFDADGFKSAQEAWLAGTGPEPSLDAFMTGTPSAPDPGELGEKDTVLMLPGTITRLIARFDRAGTFVWHCHIIEHEDNDMMRPFQVVAP